MKSIEPDEIRRNLLLALQDLQDFAKTCSDSELETIFRVSAFEREVMLDSWESVSEKSKKQRVMKLRLEAAIR